MVKLNKVALPFGPMSARRPLRQQGHAIHGAKTKRLETFEAQSESGRAVILAALANARWLFRS
jgi:hypothetical protein